MDKAVIVVLLPGGSPHLPNAGRDQWRQVDACLVADGGLRAGQVIGATNKLGEHAADRPVHFRDVFATMYHNLGIDSATTVLHDRSDRPHSLLDCRPLPELV